jgi:hypothetical protein
MTDIIAASFALAKSSRIDSFKSVVDLAQQSLTTLCKATLQTSHAILLRALFELAFTVF